MAADSKLATYRSKRRFDVTTEPAGDAPVAAAAAPRFMVHKHDATRLHYDLRLEIDGVLASWAVPKGPSYDLAQKRLAVQTEDHPLEYGDFEGRIPDGEYGAGDSIIWDRGTWDTVPPGSQQAQLKKGHLHVKLAGQKLQGEWHLLRTGSGGPKSQWLLFKAKDGQERAGSDIVAERPESVWSGRRVTRGPSKKQRATFGAEALLKKVWPPMLAQLSEAGKAPEREYVYEVKYDGFRALAAISNGQVAIQSRNANDFAAQFPWVIAPLKALGISDAVLDGELVGIGEDGVTSMGRLGDGGAAQAFVIFDVLWLEGDDLRARPVEERRELLESVLANAAEPLQISERVEGTEAQALAAAAARGLEGLIAKRRGSPYTGARSSDWKKLKVTGTAELAIAGWTPIANGKSQVGALLVAQKKGGRFVYAGKVGTGFDGKMRERLLTLLKQDEVDAPAIDDVPRFRDAHWVTPKHLAQLQFMEWTPDGKLRHPSFQGLRENAQHTEIEPPAKVKQVKPAPPPAPRVGLFGTHGSGNFGVWHSNQAHPVIHVPLTHPERVMFPKSKLTKGDVRAYYDLVAPLIVAAMKDRALSMEQFPKGLAGEGFFRQNALHRPEWIKTATLSHGSKTVEHVVIDRPETVQWLANQSALTLHMPGSRLQSLDSPDWVAFDFDPADDDFSKILPLASALRGLLEQLELDSVPKTSGKRGLHVFVPIAPGHGWDEVHAFARGVADVLAAKFSDQATTERMKNKRHGRLYLDAEQNARGKTMVAPYSVRAIEGAQVSAPLRWDEVGKKLDPARFTIQTMKQRLEQTGDLFAPVLRGGQRLPKFQ